MFAFKSIGQYQADLKDGIITCTQAVDYYLNRIDHYKHLNAFVHVFEDEAKERAAFLDKQIKIGNFKGKLFGVIVSIKDVIAYKDHPLTAASGILKNFNSLYSATAIQQMLDEGAIIIGITNCDEFGMGSANENSVYGPVKNLIHEAHTPGGSSGGSAVSVQAGLCMISLGSDTGGSVRQPADHCGIIGFKPGYGRISRYGLIAYASSFDQIGIFANSVDDVALTLEVIAGSDTYDSTVSSKVVPAYFDELKNSGNTKYKIAYLTQAIDHPSLDNEISGSIKSFIKELSDHGHEVKPVDFELIDYAVPTYYVLTTAEASSNLSRYDGIRYGPINNREEGELTSFYKANRSAGFGVEVKRRIMLGTFVLSTGYYDAYFTKAQQVRSLIIEQIQLIFNEFDFIILPTVPHTAPLLGDSKKDPIATYLADIYTVIANIAGLPAISLPLFRHTNNFPFGLQVMANRHNELPLLRFSKQLHTSGK